MRTIGIDDTDSSKHGMCTTYAATQIAKQLQNKGYSVQDLFLIRLNPAAKHKTRGNASLAIQTTAPKEVAFETARSFVFSNYIENDDETNPGIVVIEDDEITQRMKDFSLTVMQKLVSIQTARDIISENNIMHDSKGNSRGLIGSLAALGATQSFDDWTFEHIAYRNSVKNASAERNVNRDTVYTVSQNYYPTVWDTFDVGTQSSICIPNAPGPIIYGIRGDSRKLVQEASDDIVSPNLKVEQTFKTNQGTDAHLQKVQNIGDIQNNMSYVVSGEIVSEPERKEGGHVFSTISDDSGEIDIVAFEPTNQFRDIIESARPGDKVTVTGEVSNDTLKLEKIKYRELNQTKEVNPVCDNCGIKMPSAGRNAGYKCRKCSSTKEDTKTVSVSRDVEEKWYEVPPTSRRHISLPLIRVKNNQDSCGIEYSDVEPSR